MSTPIEKQEEFNQDIWYDSFDPNFLDINFKSRVTNSWMSFQVIKDRYPEYPIIPVNNYIDNIGVRPDLVSIEGNVVTLRQKAYADIYLLKEPGKDFYNVDRTWIRQYYNTRLDFNIPENCFPFIYLFFSTWIPTFSTTITYSSVDGSPIHVYPRKENWVYKDSSEYVHPQMIAFSFKRYGEHMEDDELGFVRRDDPLFDMSFSADDIIIDKIKEIYASN